MTASSSASVWRILRLRGRFSGRLLACHKQCSVCKVDFLDDVNVRDVPDEISSQMSGSV